MLSNSLSLILTLIFFSAISCNPRKIQPSDEKNLSIREKIESNDPDIPLDKIDEILRRLESQQDILDTLPLYGKILSHLDRLDYFWTKRARKAISDPLKKLKKIDKFNIEDRRIELWLSQLARQTSSLSISPLLIDFFESHPELFQHRSPSVRVSATHIMCTYYWTFNKIPLCMEGIRNLELSLSDKEKESFRIDVETMKLIALYMNGEHQKSLQAAKKLQGLFKEKGISKFAWLHIVQGACLTFNRKKQKAKPYYQKAMNVKNLSNRQKISNNIGLLSHLLFVEEIDQAQQLIHETKGLLKKTYQDFVYPHVTVSLYQLVVLLRKQGVTREAHQLVEKIREQVQSLPADAFYLDMAKAYLAKAKGEPSETLLNQLKVKMGPGVPASIRMEKGLSDHW